MKIKILIIVIISSLFLAGGTVFAIERTQKSGLFNMDIPEGWRWVEYPHEIIITYPDGQTVAIDIQMVPSVKLSEADIKKNMKESNDKIIKEGVLAHNGTMISNKETEFAGVYATQLDFKTAPPNPVYVRFIFFFNKGYAFSIKYGSGDEKLRLTLEDVVATFKFK